MSDMELRLSWGFSAIIQKSRSLEAEGLEELPGTLQVRSSEHEILSLIGLWKVTT